MKTDEIVTLKFKIVPLKFKIVTNQDLWNENLTLILALKHKIDQEQKIGFVKNLSLENFLIY